MELVIRKFIPSDGAQIVALHNISEEYFEEAQITEEFIQNIAQRDDYRFFTAEKEGKLTGYCGVLFYRSHGRAEIGPIVVSPNLRRGKIGEQLLNNVLKYLKEKGIHRVAAKVKSFNSEAQRFFTHAGFEQEGYLKKYTKKGEDVILYVKFI